MTGLRPRFLLTILAVYLVIGIATFYAFKSAVGQVTEYLGLAYASKYALANRALLQEPLTRELALARQLADSPSIRNWARNESDPGLRQRAFVELESYRRQFAEGSWFYVINSSRHYYYDNGQNLHGDTKLAYTLEPAASKDAWYFATLREVRDYALNVNYDDVLDVRKVWINVVMREPDGRAIGMAGTGLDLTGFLRTFIDHTEAGVENMLLDRRLAIQAHRNRGLIDFHSLAKPEEKRSTIARLLLVPDDMRRLKTELEKLHSGHTTATLFATIDGKRQLMGATYFSALDWYVLTILDLDKLIGERVFFPLFGVGVAMALLLLIVVGWAVNHMVLAPLATVTAAARRITDGDHALPPASDRRDEIGTLERAFSKMMTTIRAHTDELESRVHDRTARLQESNRRLDELNRALRHAADTDPLTGLLNRRGMAQHLREEVDRAARGTSMFAVYLIDIDHFKRFNDTHGHEAGDRALVEVAGAIEGVLRSYDRCSRWGGEEFLVLTPGSSDKSLGGVAERLLHAIRSVRIETRGNAQHVTASVGACVVRAGESLDSCLARTDEALYAAKRGGRDRWINGSSL